MNTENELNSLDRREFMKYMGLFSSMSFLANCSKQAEKIIPYSKEVGEFTRRNYEIYSTVINHHGFGHGILVKSFQGRPVKIEGNPSHKITSGSTSPQAQAALYDLYHPSRLQDIRAKGKKESIKNLSHLISVEQKNWKDGEGIVFWFRPDHSPALKKLIKELKAKYPEAMVLTEAPWKRTRFTNVDLSHVKEVVSFDEDLFYHRPDYLKLSRDFMARRKMAIESNSPEDMNFLTMFESSPTLAGAKADKSITLKQQDIWNAAVDLHSALEGIENESSELARKIKGKGVVFINPDLHPDARLLEEKINSLIGAQTEIYDFDVPDTHSFEDFKNRLKNQKIKTLVMLDVDPFLWHPTLSQDFKKVPLKMAISEKETTSTTVSDIVIAQSHFLECWSDLESIDKSVSIQQPLIEPIFHSISPLSFISLLNGKEQSSYDIIKTSYGDNLDKILKDGLLKSSSIASSKNDSKTFKKISSEEGFTVKIAPDYSMGFGENFSNPILQELPKAFSRIVWQNVFYLGEEDAGKLKLKHGHIIQVKSAEYQSEGPVWIVPRMARSTIVASLGYGQDKRGTNNFGFIAGEKVEIKKTLRSKKISVVQDELSTKGSHPIQETKLPLKPEKKTQTTSLYPAHPLPHQEKGPQWGMTIDLTTCTGCQACVIACQVENNVPFVGEDQAGKGRSMHWLRIDTYQVNERTFFQPVPCMHCEKAPCEVVCPVNATVHGNGGLNEMIYNRCVGTRYCSNNCPYRVRRFNFKAYSVLKYPYTLGFNPEVSVRDRGVMEKCTYCIQRIREGEFTGETTKVVSACAQVCPTQAIAFGDLRDESHEVSKQKKGPRNYDLLSELGTVPRTSYLKVIRA